MFRLPPGSTRPYTHVPYPTPFRSRRQPGAEPRPQAVAYADDLAEAGTRRQRRAVEVVDDDLPAHRRGVLALAIAAQTGGDHLAQLVGDVAGAAFRRVAELDRKSTRLNSSH